MLARERHLISRRSLFPKKWIGALHQARVAVRYQSQRRKQIQHSIAVKQFLRSLSHRNTPVQTSKDMEVSLDRSVISRALEYMLLMALTVYLGKQVKKPSRFVGRIFARMMTAVTPR